MLLVFGDGTVASVVTEYLSEPFVTTKEGGVVPFETIEQTHPPNEWEILIAVGDNKLRKRIWEESKAKGYTLRTWIHPQSILTKCTVGEGSIIFENNTIQPFAEVGKGCILWSGIDIAHHAKIGDFSYIAPHACIAGYAKLGEGCWMGVNSCVRDNVAIHPWNTVAMGACVTKNIMGEGGLYMGVPAKKKQDTEMWATRRRSLV